MTRRELGPVGVTLSHGNWLDLVEAAPELEELGYSTIWVSGAGPVLAVQQCVVLDTDPVRARTAGRGLVGDLLGGPTGYRALFRRMGFDEVEIAQVDDRLADAVIEWGEVDAVVERVTRLLAAGADHVALTVLGGSGPDGLPREQWRRLAEVLPVFRR